LGEILLAKGLLTPEQLDLALKEQRKNDEFLGKILLKNNWIKEKDLLLALSEQFNIPYMSLKYKYINLELTQRFTPTLLLDYKCFPLAMDEESVTFAITNPLDAWVIKKCEEEAKGLKTKFVLVSLEDMEEVIRRYLNYRRSQI